MSEHPAALVARYRAEFVAQFPLVRDGSPEAIHQARVVTRRLREVLRLLRADRNPKVEAALTTARALGQALGPVRELDVLADVLRSFETRLPAVAAVVATACAHLRSDQRDARRQMIKSLDRIELTGLELGGGHLWGRSWSHGWRDRLVDRLGRLGAKVERSVGHASGVYLPNRSHGLRVSVKKLRYAADTASVLGCAKPSHAVEVLKRAQSVLGELHDLHVAQRRLEGDQGLKGLTEQTVILAGTIAAEIDRRQQRFLRLRPDLLAVARHCAGLADRRRRLARRGPLLLTAAAVPGLAVLLSRRWPARA